MQASSAPEMDTGEHQAVPPSLGLLLSPLSCNRQLLAPSHPHPQPTIERWCCDRPILRLLPGLSPHELSPFTRVAWRDILVFSLPCHVNLPPAACRVDDPSRNAQASSFHPLLACSRPRSRPTCDPVSPAAFRIRSAGCSIDASMVQFVICHSNVGRHRPFSTQFSQNQGTAHIVVSTSQRSLPRSDPNT
jgi:hypothetical protein